MIEEYPQQPLLTEPPVDISLTPTRKLRNYSLESIQQDIKKSIGELESHARRLEDYLAALRATLNDMSRGLG